MAKIIESVVINMFALVGTVLCLIMGYGVE